jgi:hypothetical protein
LAEALPAVAGALFGVAAAAGAEARLFVGVVALAYLAVELRCGVSGSTVGGSSGVGGDMILKKGEDEGPGQQPAFLKADGVHL